VSFRLVEKMDAPFRGSRGKGIQPRTQEVFEDLGMLERMTAAGGPYPLRRMYLANGGTTESPIAEPVEPTPAEPYRLPWMVPQFLSEGVMRERLAELGHRPAFGCELIGFEQDDGGVTARLAGPMGEETLRARYLVGADGGRSAVRQALGIGFPGRTLGVRAMVADVVLTGLGREVWHHFNEGATERQISVCPLAGTDLFQLQAPVPLEGDVDLAVAGLNALLAERTGRGDVRVHSVSWASAFRMNARLADRYRIDRVFLVGDAAHVHPPTGGQGLNTSVQDAYNLGWKLAAVLGGAPQPLLDSYEEERRPVAAHVLGLSTTLLDAAKQGDMRRGREVHQLDIGYAGSSLALQAPGRDATGPLRAGDRAPDAPLLGAAGHWTLVGLVAAPRAVPPRAGLRIHIVGAQGDLLDDGGHLRSAYGTAPGDWVLVRPDGHVGAIVASDGLPALERYLAGVGLPADELAVA
jgi:2-polyprenyl-6-methoxyphenol hydroxylase-like FAD-dependent oxidoreductase